MITVIDYGIGNIGSILNMFRKIGAPCQTTKDPDTISHAEKLVLPGVGSFDAGMRSLVETGMDRAIINAANKDTPLLGVCLGMQLMTRGSAEGTLSGLNLISGHCVKFDLKNQGLRVPHMGWNVVTPTDTARLFNLDEEELRYYFVHSYHVVCDDASDIAAETTYGLKFTCAFQHGNIYGAQFHPEKSHRYGMDMFRKFAKV
ncbi:MAG TPA: imidazole glycerol phosphate synthase subunit HisH [Roseobacter sp.]|uniref:Glutamine amidotransferase domain-containing protein n=1 Tax=marine sediment metagenome TaxID=412755 RepID=A0A0F9WBM4_9ZZZZ|nr:imidazole glycerol phosphate synthase subunit HisH [Roseobacter sp.]|tara:strand:+ start:6226 stop:6831 length:606 start_codon:yes stop_codon:yes gene_type:complete